MQHMHAMVTSCHFHLQKDRQTKYRNHTKKNKFGIRIQLAPLAPFTHIDSPTVLLLDLLHTNTHPHHQLKTLRNSPHSLFTPALPQFFLFFDFHHQYHSRQCPFTHRCFTSQIRCKHICIPSPLCLIHRTTIHTNFIHFIRQYRSTTYHR